MKLNIVVGGGFSYVPFTPGAAWTRLEQSLGLVQLGHNVLIVEQVGDNWCYDRNGNKTDYEHSWSRQLFSSMMSRHGLLQRASQIFKDGQAVTGVPLAEVLRFARDADVLINNSGHISLESILRSVKRRVYVDLDPVYTQLWYTEYGKHQTLDDHDTFFTAGANIGTRRSDIPDCGKVWHYLPRIVDLDHWPYSFDDRLDRITTVANWSGFGELTYRGRTFKPKYSEFLQFSELPKAVRNPLEVCLKNYDPGDSRIQKLLSGGWEIVNATTRLDSLESYRDYISHSRAEIGIAQNAYVEGHSGWFSDRSAHYLASGKPVVAQATGFEEHLPVGAGLFAFRTIEEAADAISAVNSDYATHCRKAREIAAEHFDYRKVLPAMLDRCRL